MRISDWSSDVCSSDLGGHGECPQGQARGRTRAVRASAQGSARSLRRGHAGASRPKKIAVPVGQGRGMIATIQQGLKDDGFAVSISQLCRRSEEHTSELQSLMRNSYAVFCLKKKKKYKT